MYRETKGDTAVLHVTVPVNTTATICLDGAKEVTDADGLNFEKDNICMKAEAVFVKEKINIP